MVQNQAYVDIYTVQAQLLHAVLLDVTGRTVAEYKEQLISGNNSIPVNTSMLIQCIYNLQVKTDDGVIANLRLVKE